MKRSCRAALVAVSVAIPAAAVASDTVDYVYDTLGRLISASTAGGPNSGALTSTSYDPAGNRCGYSLRADGTDTAPACTTTGGTANQAPVAANDGGSMTRCADAYFAVLGNDSDPDGNLPLALDSVSGGSGRGTPGISGTRIAFTPNDIVGTAVVGYVMRDSLGAKDSATLTITISHGDCPPLQ